MRDIYETDAERLAMEDRSKAISQMIDGLYYFLGV